MELQAEATRDLQAEATRHPAFFKVFYQNFSDMDLRIPSTKIAYPENVVLRDKNGISWNLTMKKDSEYWSFKDGWVNFKVDNQLVDGDLITFEYISESLFSVNVFDGSACEKTISDDFTFSIPKAKGKRKPTKVGSRKKRKNKYKSNRVAGEKEDARDKAEAPKKRLNVKEQLDSEVFETGLAPQPANPYLVTKVKPKRRHELFIPSYLLKTNEVEFAEMMILVDPHGRRFYAKRNKAWRKGSRTYYSGGWKVLCRKNMVSDEDYCIVEFVRGDDGNFLGNVSFVRVEAGP